MTPNFCNQGSFCFETVKKTHPNEISRTRPGSRHFRSVRACRGRGRPRRPGPRAHHGPAGDQIPAALDHGGPRQARGPEKNVQVGSGGYRGLPVLPFGGDDPVQPHHPLDLERRQKRQGRAHGQGQVLPKQLLHFGQQYAGQGVPVLPPRVGQKDRGDQLPGMPRSKGNQLGRVVRRHECLSRRC
jgi:hypothetical protein